ncbi:MAG: hypothetical protein ACI4Q0_01245 [Oligosphaeraceae bacterium]
MAPPSPRPPFPQREWVFNAHSLRYTQILRLLFSHPMLGCGLLRLRNFWGGTLLFLFLFIFLGGFVLTLHRAPDYGADIRRATDFILEKTGGFQWEGEGLRWQRESPLPAQESRRLGHFALVLAPRWEEFTPPSSGAKQGVVLCPEGLGFWASPPSEGEGDFRQLLPARRLADSGLPPLLPASQNTFCRFLFLPLFLSLMILHSLELARLVVTTGVALTAVWLFLSPQRNFRLLPSFFLRGLNMTIPPLLATLLWGLAGIPLSLDTSFTILLLLYVLYANYEGRGGMMTAR